MTDSDTNELFLSADSDSSFFSLNDSFSEPTTLRYLLTQKFHGLTNNFNVCYINAQSIPQHYNELVDTFHNQSISAILVSESWLKPTLPSTSFGIPGFVLLRNDRTGKRGGGVAVYLRNGIPYKQLCASSPVYSGTIEYMFLEITYCGTKTVLGAVYCPPGVNYFCDLESALSSIGSDYQHFIIMGDFNTDILCNSARSSELYTVMNSFNLSLLSLDPTHHNLDTADSLIDLIVVASEDHVVGHGQLSAPGFSRHDLLYISYRIKCPKVNHVMVHLRNLARLNVEELQQGACSIDWSDTYSAESVDEKVALFNSNIQKLFDKHAPPHKVRLKRSPAPWITEDIRRAMAKRDREFSKYKSNRCTVNWTRFKAARNRCNQMVRAAKRRYIHRNILNASMADSWKFLKSIGIGKPASNFDPSIFSVNQLNTYFSTAPQLHSSIKSTTIAHVKSLPKCYKSSFNFSPVTDEDIKKSISSIKSAAVGSDDVSRNMINLILDYVLPVLTHIVNFSLDTGVFPSLWRNAFVLPLPKINNPSTVSHFRPISILPFLSKVLEAVAHRQISDYVFKNNFLSSYQSGFRSGHSTTTALLKVTEDLRIGMEESKLTVLVLIDFSNAFNAVDHDILLTILSHIGFSSSAREWFASYLQGRQQAVRVGPVISDWCTLVAGVPQGGILSPLLFSIFINLITSHIRCTYHLYADDLQIYAQSDVNDIEDAITELNSDLTRISDWSSKFGITVNPTKCQAIIVGSSRRLSTLDFNSLPPVNFNNAVIPYSATVKNLGLIIDSSLSWRPQVTEVSKKVINTLRCLYRFKNFLPVRTKVMLVQTLVLPILDYADVCYADASQELLNKLDRLLNNCIRFIFGLRKFDHVSSFRSQLKWLPLPLRRSFRILTMLFSILHDPFVPAYLKCKFQYQGDSHNRCLRSAENLTLHVPFCRTGFSYNSFTSNAVRLWNMLPKNIKEAKTKPIFKRSLWEYYLTKQ